MVPASGRVCVVIGPSWSVRSVGRGRRPRALTPVASRDLPVSRGRVTVPDVHRAATRVSAGAARLCPMSAEALLDALDPEQRAVATTLRGPVRVLAGAGTGKTRAITHRIAYGIQVGAYRPANVLAVTFTARAAGEMRTRLRAARCARGPGPHVPRGRAAAARVLLAQGRGRPAAADPRAEGQARRARRPAGRRSRPTGRACGTWRPRSSGPRSAWSRPTTTRRPPPRRTGPARAASTRSRWRA